VFFVNTPGYSNPNPHLFLVLGDIANKIQYIANKI